MKTITIIDLFNKMAKGEEVPKKFKYGDNIYYLQDGIGFDYCYRCDEIDDIFESSFTFEILNDEIEIIEDTPKEENKIPEKLKLYAPYPECDDKRFDVVEAKINEIIEYLESKGK